MPSNRRPSHLALAHSVARGLVLLFALLTLVVTPSAAAQGADLPSRPADEPRGSFGDAIEVRLIDVEVVVTDQQGNRVPGLTADDFTLYVSGQEAPIAFFDEVRDGRYVPEGIADLPTTAAAPEALPPVGTSYLLFLDDYFTRPPYRNLVLKGLAKDLEALGPEDRFAAVAFDGERLEVLADWIPADDEAVAKVLVAARKRDGWKAFLEQQRFRTTPRNSINQDQTSERIGMSHLMADQLERTYSAVATALRTFADVPGRRVALVVAGGWPHEINEDFFTRSALFDTRRPLRRVADVANATGFTLYPIDAPGSEGGAGSADSLDLATDTAFGLEAAGEREEYSLVVLAEQTGGEPLLDGQRLRSLKPVLEDTRSYYWMSFQYQRQGDGGLRTIEVEVDRPGLEVRSRKGFIDISKAAEAEMKAERALLLGEDVEPTLEVQLGATQRAGRRMDVPFAVIVPVPELSLEPLANGGGLARLDLRVAVEDSRGDRAEISNQELELPLSPELRRMEGVAYEAAVRLRRKPHVLVFVLTEPATGQTWMARHEVRPGE